MPRIINESDTFQLLVKENIDSQDYQYLFMLYQPIIGVRATNLYLTLVQEKHLTDRINLDFTHTRLMLLLDLNQVELLHAFQALEAHQLLSSYHYPSKATYIYHIKKPLNASKFFADEKLAAKLSQQIGSLQFERQKYYFLKYQPEITDDFIDVTTEFTMQYEDQESNKINLQQLMVNLNKAQTNIKNVKPFTQPTNNFAQLKANLTTSSTTNISYAKNNVIVSQIAAKTPDAFLIKLTGQAISPKVKQTLQQLSFNYHLNDDVINCLIEYVWFKNHRIEPNYILKIAKTFSEKDINTVADARQHLTLALQKSKKSSYGTKKYQQDVLWVNDVYEFDQSKTKNVIDDNAISEQDITKILEEIDNF